MTDDADVRPSGPEVAAANLEAFLRGNRTHMDEAWRSVPQADREQLTYVAGERRAEALEPLADELSSVEGMIRYVRGSYRESGLAAPALDEADLGTVMGNVVRLAGEGGMSRRDLVKMFDFLDQEQLQGAIEKMLNDTSVTRTEVVGADGEVEHPVYRNWG